MVDLFGGKEITFRNDMKHEEIRRGLPVAIRDTVEKYNKDETVQRWQIVRNRCFLGVTFGQKEGIVGT